MSNELQKFRLPLPANIAEIDAAKWRVLTESIFPNAKTPEAIVLALDYCKARKLDPFKKPVNIVPMWNSSLKKNVETVWPSINEVQVTASRTGKYAGMDEPKWGEVIKRIFKGKVKGYDDEGNWQDDVEKEIYIEYPEWCSVTVYRIVDGQKCAFTEPVFWEEAYARQGKTNIPNIMWGKRPRGQLLKVAKAFSLRAAFPEEGEYVAEEMEGKEIAAGGIVIENTPKTSSKPMIDEVRESMAKLEEAKKVEISLADWKHDLLTAPTMEGMKHKWKECSKLYKDSPDEFQELYAAKEKRKAELSVVPLGSDEIPEVA